MYIRNRVLSLLYKLAMLAVCGYGLFMSMGFLTSGFKPMVFYSFSVLSNLIFFIFCFISVITVIVKMAGSGIKGGDGFSASLKGISLTTLALSSLGFFLLITPPITTNGAFASEILFASTPHQLILSGGTVSMFMFLLVPIMAFIDWLLFAKKGRFLLSDSLIWLLAPMSYFLVAVISGTLRANYGSAAIYPYSFLNVTALGWAQVFINASVFLLITFVLGCLLILFDKLLNLFAKDKQSKDENDETPPPNGGGKKNDVKVVYVNNPEEEDEPRYNERPAPAAPNPETPRQNNTQRHTQEEYYTPQQTPHFPAQRRNNEYTTGTLDNSIFENRAFTEPLVQKKIEPSTPQIFEAFTQESPLRNGYQAPPQTAPLNSFAPQNINYENSRASRYITGSFSAIPAAPFYNKAEPYSRTAPPSPAPMRPQDINVIEPQYMAPQTTSSFAALRNELPNPDKATATYASSAAPLYNNTPAHPHYAPPAKEPAPPLQQDSPLYRTKPFPAFSESSPQQFVQLTPAPQRSAPSPDVNAPAENPPRRETVQEHSTTQPQNAAGAPSNSTYTPDASNVSDQPLTAPLGAIHQNTQDYNSPHARNAEQEYFRNTVNINEINMPAEPQAEEPQAAEPPVLHWRSNLPTSNTQPTTHGMPLATAPQYAAPSTGMPQHYGQPVAAQYPNPYTGVPRHTAQLPIIAKSTSPSIYSSVMPPIQTAPTVHPEQAGYTGEFFSPSMPIKTGKYADNELSDHNKLQYPVGFSSDENI